MDGAEVRSAQDAPVDSTANDELRRGGFAVSYC
jgi:hypothetical protein